MCNIYMYAADDNFIKIAQKKFKMQHVLIVTYFAMAMVTSLNEWVLNCKL